MGKPVDSSWPWTQAPAVLVTGANRGLGRAVAEAFTKKGAVVYVSGRQSGDVAAAAEEMRATGADARPLTIEVTDTASLQAAAAVVDADLGRLDVLVNNAAAYVDWTETALGADLEASRRVMDINLYGAWSALQTFLPLLRRSEHPRVVNVASGAGSHGDPNSGSPPEAERQRATPSARQPCFRSPAPSRPNWLTPPSSSTPSTPTSPPPGRAPSRWEPALRLKACPASFGRPRCLTTARGAFFRDGQALPGDPGRMTPRRSFSRQAESLG